MRYYTSSLVDRSVSFFLLLSGASALMYQVVWVRLLGLSIGSTSVSISIALAVFFLGLGLGSYFTGGIIKKFKNPLKIYIAVEAGIALSAVAILPLLLKLDYFISLLPIIEAGVWLKFFIVTLILIIPTFLIGTTFALLVAVAIHHEDEIGGKLANLYAFNSLGAVIGAISSGFFLIPQIGLDGTLYVAALLNILVAITGTILYKYLNNSSEELPQQPSIEDVKTNQKALFVLFVTGFTALATEVGWMKFLIVYTGNTIYGFSMILAMFIAGIVIGSFVAKLKIISKIDSEKLLFFGLVLLAVALLVARVGLGVFPEIYEQLNSLEVSEFVYRWSKYLAIFFILLPATALFGMLFPIALKYYSVNIDALHANVGRAYSLNIIAGILGSIVAGFWIIPYFSTDILLTFMALFVLGSSFVFIKDKKISFGWIGFLAIFAVLSYYLAHIDYRAIVNIVQQRDLKKHSYNTESKIHYIKEGQTGIIGLHSYKESPCVMRLFNNGMSESWVDMCNRNNLLFSEFLLGEIPLLINNSAKKAFVVGYGGGTTVRALSMSDLESINIVEIEPAVLDAMRTLYEGKLPTENDKRVNVKINDARNSLLMSKENYDIIVSQPSHPWLSGASNIMSRDFFEIAKLRLSQNGVYGQWVPLYYIDTATLKGIIKAYTDTFEYVISFVNFQTREFLMFGSKQPMVFNYETMQKQMLRPDANAVFKHYNMTIPEDLMGSFALSREQLVEICANSMPATDKNLLTETFKSRYEQMEGNSFDTVGFLKKYISNDK